MKIAFICASILPLPAVLGGGTETIIQNIIDVNEEKKEIDIKVYSYFNSNAVKVSNDFEHTSFEYYTPTRLKKIIDLFFRGIRRLSNRKLPFYSCYLHFCKKKCLEYNPDYIVIEGNQMQVEMIKRKTNGKIVLHMHTDLLNSDTPNGNNIIRDCTRILTVSDFCKKRVLSIAGANSDRIKVLHNVINYNLFSKNTFSINKINREQLGIKNNYPIILFCGRLDQGKGLSELLEALAMLDRNYKWNLLVIGGSLYSGNRKSEYITDIEKKAKKFSNTIVFTGHLKHDDIPYYYDLCKFTVFPSICNEAAGLITLESLAMGKPVITTGQGGIPEYADPKSCIILDVNDKFIENLSESISRFLTDENYYNKFRDNAKKGYLRRNIYDYYNEFVALLEDIENEN